MVTRAVRSITNLSAAPMSHFSVSIATSAASSSALMTTRMDVRARLGAAEAFGVNVSRTLNRYRVAAVGYSLLNLGITSN
jgi:hypothetical protein